MSEGLWERRFGRDPEILSKTILLNGEPHVVIGILGDSPGLRELGIYSDVYLPFQIDPDTADEGNYFKEDVMDVLHYGEESVSVGFEEISSKDSLVIFSARRSFCRSDFPGQSFTTTCGILPLLDADSIVEIQSHFVSSKTFRAIDRAVLAVGQPE
jgi:hypothetical protein